MKLRIMRTYEDLRDGQSIRTDFHITSIVETAKAKSAVFGPQDTDPAAPFPPVRRRTIAGI